MGRLGEESFKECVYRYGLPLLLEGLNPVNHREYVVIDCPRCGKKKSAYIYSDGLEMRCNRLEQCGFSQSLFDYLYDRHNFSVPSDVFGFLKNKMKRHPDDGVKRSLKGYEVDYIKEYLTEEGLESHGYVKKKGIRPYSGWMAKKNYKNLTHNSLFYESNLLIPFADLEGEIGSYQRIYWDEKEGKWVKSNLAGHKVRNLFCCIGNLGGEDIVLVEGWATGCSIHEALGYTVLCCGGWNNVEHVLEKLIEARPYVRIIIGGDLGVGEKVATLARKWLLEWTLPSRLDDFNDVHVESGLKGVKKEFEKNLKGFEQCKIKRGEGDEGEETEFHLPLLSKGGSLLLYGAPGTMKTYFCLYFLLKLAVGGRFFQWEVKPTKVMYIFGEMSEREIQGRKREIKEGEGMSGEVSSFFLHIPTNVVNHTLDNELFQADLFKKLVRYGIEVVVFDNLSCLRGRVKEDSADDWTLYHLPFFEKLSKLGVASILVHHAGKNGLQRGTSAREGYFETIVKLSPLYYGKDQQLGKGVVEIEKLRLGTIRHDQRKFAYQFNVVEAGEGFAHILDKDEEREKQILSIIKRGKNTLYISDILNEVEGVPKSEMVFYFSSLNEKGWLMSYIPHKPLVLTPKGEEYWLRLEREQEIQREKEALNKYDAASY